MIPYDTAIDMGREAGTAAGEVIAAEITRPKQYQYEEVVRFYQVQELAKQGWRMVHIVPASGSGEDRWLTAYIMEREVPYSEQYSEVRAK